MQRTMFRLLVLVCSFLYLALPLQAQITRAFSRYDRDLIDKLYRGDFAHVSDDNWGRMDLEAVLVAFRTDKEAATKCSIMGVEEPSAAQMTTVVAYIKYLNSNSTTGKFPSAEFMTLSVLSAGTDLPGVWALHPNWLAMAHEIENSGCKSARVQKIRENFIRLLDQRIEWHSKDQSTNIHLTKQAVKKITQQAYSTAVQIDVALPAQEPALRQIADLEARGAQLVDCEYGPTNPDSTGSQTLTFWYGSVPLTMGDFQKVSRKHPLGNFGDAAIMACPVTLSDAKNTFRNSRQIGINKLDQSALAPHRWPLDRLMGQMYPLYQQTKKSWISYQTTHDPRDQQRAVAGKSQLLKSYGQSCEMTKKAGDRGPNNVICQISQQLADEFQDIPNAP